jgi:hypothetical protein
MNVSVSLMAYSDVIHAFFPPTVASPEMMVTSPLDRPNDVNKSITSMIQTMARLEFELTDSRYTVDRRDMFKRSPPNPRHDLCVCEDGDHA